MMGKKDAKGSKSAKTAKLVKMEKSPKAQVSIDEVKIMPPPFVNVRRFPNRLVLRLIVVSLLL